MKFMMIFEGVDRATKVMNKITAAQKKTADAVKAGAKASGNATKGAARATEKQASALSKVGSAARSAYATVQRGAVAAGRSIVDLHRKTVALGRLGLSNIGAGAGKVMRGVGVAAGIAGTLVGTSALAANHLLDTATAFESYRIQLETLEGSAAKGKAAMDWITEFAVKTPLELDQVVESYRNMKTFGLDPTNGSLMTLVDTMAASGKGVEHLDGLILAMGQAWTKEKLQGEEALQLLERGVPVWEILSQKYGKTASELQEMASKGKLGREAIQYLMEEIGRRNAGASEKMSRTWKGMIGNLMDTWLQFKLAIMDAGLFDWMKGKLQSALDTVNQMAASGTFEQWAKSIGDKIILVLETAWQFATNTYAIFEKLGGYLSAAAGYVGGWENLAMVLAGIAFAPMLISTAAGIVQIAMGLSILSAALMANPIVLLIAAIVAGAAAIYFGWEPIKAFFIDLWASIGDGAQRAWSYLSELLGFDPLAVVGAAWSGLKNAVAAAMGAAGSAASAAWEGIKLLFAWTPLGMIIANWSGISGAVTATLDGVVSGAAVLWDGLKTLFAWTPLDMIIANWSGISGAVRSAFDGVVSGATVLWDGLKTLFAWTPLGMIIANWSGISGAVTATLDGVVSGAAVLWDGLKTLFAWTPLGMIVANWSGVSGAVTATLDGVVSGVTAVWGRLKAIFEWSPAEAIKAAWAGISDLVGGLVDGVVAKAGMAWEGVKSIFTFGDNAAPSLEMADPATIKATAAATAALRADLQAVAAIDTGPAMAKLTALDQAAARIKQSVTSSITQAQAFLANVSFYNQGAALMDTMAAGIRARAAVVVAEIAKMAQAVRDHLPSSPAKVGPLSDIHRLKFAETIAGSIRPAPMVKAMRAAAAATLAAATITAPAMAAPAVAVPSALPNVQAARAEVARASLRSDSSSGAPTIHFSPTVKLPDGMSGKPADVEAAVQRALRSSARELADMLDEEYRRRGRREF